MRALAQAAGWMALGAAVLLAAGGAFASKIPATGLVVGLPLAGLMLRESARAPLVLAEALRGRLAVEEWPEAARYAGDMRRFGVGIAWGAAALSGAQAPWLPAEQWAAAAGSALAPLIIAHALGWLVWGPLRASLEAEYAAWLAGVREALTPVDLPADAPALEIPARYRELLRRVA